jgi:hypothetical protein
METINNLFPELVKPIICNERTKQNLLMYVVNFMHEPVLAISQDKQWFNKQHKRDWHTYAFARRAWELLVHVGLIKLVRKGTKAKKGFKSGFSTIYCITPKFKRLFGKIPLAPVTVDSAKLPNIIIDDWYYKDGNEPYFFKPKFRKSKGKRKRKLKEREGRTITIPV